MLVSPLIATADGASSHPNLSWIAGFTSREGGESLGEYSGLNLGYHVGDEPERVSFNRRAVERELGCELVWMSQIHSDIWKDASEAERTSAGNLSVGEADALILEAEDVGPDGLGIAVMVADCIPFILFDEIGGRGAVVHVGRAGLDAGITLRVLDEMARRGTEFGDVHAVIGPSICGACYEVPEDMADDVGGRWPAARSTTSWGTPALDLPSALAGQLSSRGVTDIKDVGTCTLEDETYFSHRRSGRDGSPAGRFAGIVALSPR